MSCNWEYGGEEAAKETSMSFTWTNSSSQTTPHHHQNAFSSTSPIVNQSDYERALNVTHTSTNDQSSRLRHRRNDTLSDGFSSLTLSVEHTSSSLLNVTLSPMVPLHEPPASPVTDYNRALRELEELSREEDWSDNGFNGSGNAYNNAHRYPVEPQSQQSTMSSSSYKSSTPSHQPSSSSPIAFCIEPSRSNRSSKVKSQSRSSASATTNTTARSSEVFPSPIVNSLASPSHISSNFREVSRVDSLDLKSSSLESPCTSRSSLPNRRSRQHCDLSQVRAALNSTGCRSDDDTFSSILDSPQSATVDGRHQRKHATYSYSQPATPPRITNSYVPDTESTSRRSSSTSRSSSRHSSRSRMLPSRRVEPQFITQSPRLHEDVSPSLLELNEQRARLRNRHLSHKSPPQLYRLHPFEQSIDSISYETASPSASPRPRHQLGSSFGSTVSLGERSSELSEFDEDQGGLYHLKHSSNSSQDSFPIHSTNPLLNPRRAASVMKSRRSRRYDSSNSESSDSDEDPRSYSSRSSSRSSRHPSTRSSVAQLVVDGHAIADVPLDRLRAFLQLSEPNTRRSSKRMSRVYA